MHESIRDMLQDRLEQAIPWIWIEVVYQYGGKYEVIVLDRRGSPRTATLSRECVDHLRQYGCDARGRELLREDPALEWLLDTQGNHEDEA